MEESDFKLLKSLNNTYKPNIKFTEIRPLINGFARKIYYHENSTIISVHEGTFEKGIHAGFGRILQSMYSVKASIGFLRDTYNDRNPFDWSLELTNSLPLGKGITYHGLDPGVDQIFEGIFENDLARYYTQRPAVIQNINSFEKNE